MQTPNDSSFTLPGLQYLPTAPGRALLREARDLPDTAATVERLRKNHPREAVHVALTLARLHKKAALKFPTIETIYAPQEALEQATSLAVARHKATRFAAYLAGKTDPLLLDACSGIGGDALALAQIARVLAVDISPVRLHCLEQNAQQLGLSARIQTLCTDIETLDISRFNAFHIDPSRRAAGRRHHNYADLIPGPQAVERLIARIPAGVVKLSPGVQFESLPPGHIELITEEGTAVQALLWTGELAHGKPGRTATGIRHGTVTYTLTGALDPVSEIATPMTWIGEVEAGLHRAGLAVTLARQLNAHALNADGGLLTAPHKTPHAALAWFTHVTTIDYSESRVQDLLRTLPAAKMGPVEVKTRGGLGVDTDRLQKLFSKSTPSAYSVLIYRGPHRAVASIALRDI